MVKRWWYVCVWVWEVTWKMHIYSFTTAQYTEKKTMKERESSCSFSFSLGENPLWEILWNPDFYSLILILFLFFCYLPSWRRKNKQRKTFRSHSSKPMLRLVQRRSVSSGFWRELLMKPRKEYSYISIFFFGLSSRNWKVYILFFFSFSFCFKKRERLYLFFRLKRSRWKKKMFLFFKKSKGYLKKGAVFSFVFLLL